MRFRIRCFVPLLAVCLGFPVGAGEMPDKYTNLDVLPKDIGKREMLRVMREFSRALGVGCDHCHVRKGEGADHQEDLVSDALEPKSIARRMYRMTQEINAKLPATAAEESPLLVRCATCHRGLLHPEGLDQILFTVVDEHGVTAAIERYGELRKKYYGSGSYDFRPRVLNEVAERVAERDDVDGALRIVRLNLEHDPDAPATHVLLGQLLAAKGDKAAAIASIEKALALEPGHHGATRALAQIRTAE
jgi:hypothetical protein